MGWDGDAITAGQQSSSAYRDVMNSFEPNLMHRLGSWISNTPDEGDDMDDRGDDDDDDRDDRGDDDRCDRGDDDDRDADMIEVMIWMTVL
jgi:hypothetical protein